MTVIDSSAVQCSLPGHVVVGRYPVSAQLNGQNGSRSVDATTGTAVHVDRLCGAGAYAAAGAYCTPCPSNAQCLAYFPTMLPLPGYYPSSATTFVACVPASACPGVDAAVVQASLASADAADVHHILDTFFANGSDVIGNVTAQSPSSDDGRNNTPVTATGSLAAQLYSFPALQLLNVTTQQCAEGTSWRCVITCTVTVRIACNCSLTRR